MHWALSYLKYSTKEYNCAELVRLVLREQFNIDFIFPQTKHSVRKDSQQIKANLSVFTSEQTKYPNEGDLVLMSGSSRLCHVGLYVTINNKGYVLHSMKNASTVCLHELKDLKLYGLVLNGFYKWQNA